MSHDLVSHDLVSDDLVTGPLFDTSMVTKGKSLSNQIYSGPDLLNGLIGVFLRFRIHNYAIMGDLEKFYHSVRIPEEDRDLYRFLWLKDETDIDAKLIQLKLRVHLFGGNSSQSCCALALFDSIDQAVTKGKLAQDEGELLKKMLYSDDFLGSFHDPRYALNTSPDSTNYSTVPVRIPTLAPPMSKVAQAKKRLCHRRSRSRPRRERAEKCVANGQNHGHRAFRRWTHKNCRSPNCQPSSLSTSYL